MLLGAAACSTDDTTASTDTSAAVDTAADGVTVSGVWARTSPTSADNGAAYMTITATEDDELLSASVPDTIATEVQLHESSMGGTDDTTADGTSGDMDAETSDDSMADGSSGAMGDDMTDDTMGGMGGEMTMQEVQAIPVTAGEDTVLEPGGYHVMLLGLVEPLAEGDTFDITLKFANAGELTVTAEVRSSAP
jgi:copper(I)-binding protein